MIYDLIKISLIVSVFSFLGEPEQIFAFYRRWIMKLPSWLNKPLGSCNLCMTGQACLWFYLIKYFSSYNLIDHLFFISAGILLSSIYSSIYYYDTD
jgi:hypothetical protein